MTRAKQKTNRVKKPSNRVPRAQTDEAETINDVRNLPSSDRNVMRTYMQEIGKTPLLSKEEECELAKRIKKGDKEARDHMISANLRLVVKIAHDYNNFGLQLLDRNDVAYKTRREKYAAVVREIEDAHHKGQPVLVVFLQARTGHATGGTEML